MRLYFSILLFTALLWANAQTIDTIKPVNIEPKVLLRWHPVALAISTLFPYCGELKFAVDIKLAKKHSFPIGVAFLYPGVGGLISQAFRTIGNGGDKLYFFGANTKISYRYFFKRPGQVFNGIYLGPEVSFAYVVSNLHKDGDPRNYSPYSYTPTFRTNGIMTNYNFTLGGQWRAKKRSHLVIDVSVSFGYRYHYFWNKFDEGNLELEHAGLYGFYKLIPIGGSYSFSIGGF